VVNHLRTLLLDVDGSLRPGREYPGEEYVPPDFRTRVYPAGLRQVWRALFGTYPDRAYRNYRLRQLTTLVHDSPLAELVTALDRRVTYWPHRADDDRWARYGTTRIEAVNDSQSTLNLIGDLVADDTIGRARFEWRVEVLSGNRVRVGDTTYDVTYPGGLSTSVPLGAGLTCRVHQSGLGDAWYVSAVAKPARDVGAVLASAETAVGSAERVLFSGGEPYDTLGEMWRRADFLPLRLGALVVALAYRVDESRAAP
jgi:hypothetical protein